MFRSFHLMNKQNYWRIFDSLLLILQVVTHFQKEETLHKIKIPHRIDPGLLSETHEIPGY